MKDIIDNDFRLLAKTKQLLIGRLNNRKESPLQYDLAFMRNLMNLNIYQRKQWHGKIVKEYIQRIDEMESCQNP